MSTSNWLVLLGSDLSKLNLFLWTIFKWIYLFVSILLMILSMIFISMEKYFLNIKSKFNKKMNQNKYWFSSYVYFLIVMIVLLLLNMKIVYCIPDYPMDVVSDYPTDAFDYPMEEKKDKISDAFAAIFLLIFIDLILELLINSIN